MTKDRLKELKRSFSDEEDAQQLDLIVEIPNDKNVLFQEVEDVRFNIEQIQQIVRDVKVRYSAKLAETSNDQRLDQELYDLTEAFKTVSSQIRVKLKGMETDIESEEKESLSRSSADLRIRKNLHSSLSREFVEVFTKYNLSQTVYRENLKARLVRQIQITGRHVTDEDVERMLEHGESPSVFVEGIVMNTVKARNQLAEIEARHKDIMRLEGSIRELQEMFLDMTLLVENQGDMVDRIEFHVNNAVDFVQAATKDTKKAMVYQNKTRRNKLMLLGCLSAGLVVFLIVLVYLALR